MLILSGGKGGGGLPLNQNVRSRPVISGGTVRTDTGQIIRSARVANGEPAAQDPATWVKCRAAGINCMRFGIKSGSEPPESKFAEIDAVVAAARNNRCYVMLGNPEAAPGTWVDDIATNKAKSLANWRAWAPRYKDEPHVFYELINEPEAWGRYTNYCNTDGVPNDLTIALREVFDVMRSLAPETIILAPSPANIDAAGGAVQYIKAIQAFESLGPIDWSRAAWSFHCYNQTARMLVNGKSDVQAPDNGRAALDYIKSRYPIMGTETNFWMEFGRRSLIDMVDMHELAQVGWTMMTYPGQVGPLPPVDPDAPPGTTIREDWPDSVAMYDPPGYILRKLDQLRSRGFVIPVE